MAKTSNERKCIPALAAKEALTSLIEQFDGADLLKNALWKWFTNTIGSDTIYEYDTSLSRGDLTTDFYLLIKFVDNIQDEGAIVNAQDILEEFLLHFTVNELISNLWLWFQRTIASGAIYKYEDGEDREEFVMQFQTLIEFAEALRPYSHT